MIHKILGPGEALKHAPHDEGTALATRTSTPPADQRPARQAEDLPVLPRGHPRRRGKEVPSASREARGAGCWRRGV